MVTVKIRTKEHESRMNPALQEALSFLIKNPHKETPLVYQYLHNPNTELLIDTDNKIGTITNVRRDNEGDIVGDVTINNMLKLSSNFIGVIDNMAASIHPDTNRAEIDAFIIYDKDAKEKVKASNKKKLDAFSKAGEIPIMSHTGNDTMKEISEKLLKEYENMIAEQNIKTEKED